MFGNYNKNSDISTSNSNIFNVSGQNIMTNNKSIESILSENKKLKEEILKKNKEIDNAKKRLNIIEEEIRSLRRQKNNNNQIRNRGKSVGMRNNINLNNNYNNGFNGGMFNNNDDPFSDPFFNFDDGMPKNDDSVMEDQIKFGYI